MLFTPLKLKEVILIEPRIFNDERGYFMESYNQRVFAEQGFPAFVQDNHSLSGQGVLRGLHLQTEPHPQGKLVRVVSGAIFDVAVDIRPGSATFGLWVGERLDEENRRMLYIPPGFAHGFLSLADHTQVLYKTTDYFYPAHDAGIRWNDPDIAIDWPDVGVPLKLSAKDQALPGLRALIKKSPPAP